MSQPDHPFPPPHDPQQRRERVRRRGPVGRRPAVLVSAGIGGVAVLLAGVVFFRVAGPWGSGDDAERAALTGTPGETAVAGQAGVTGTPTTTPGTPSASPSSPTPSASASSATRTPRASATAGGSGAGGASGVGQAFGAVHHGSYHLGPVQWSGSFHNSCAPYPASVQSLEGQYLAGVDQTLNGDGSLCDATAVVTTRLGKTITVRIVTTGLSKSPGDMDLSPAAFNAIHQVDPKGTSADPRPMTWRLVKAPANGPIRLQYQTGANPWWASLWVRNPRLPVAKVEVRKSGGSSTYTTLTRANDGTLTDSKGFGSGPFTLRITASDGQVVSQRFTSFTPGSVVTTTMQFR